MICNIPKNASFDGLIARYNQFNSLDMTASRIWAKIDKIFAVFDTEYDYITTSKIEVPFGVLVPIGSYNSQRVADNFFRSFYSFVNDPIAAIGEKMYQQQSGQLHNSSLNPSTSTQWPNALQHTRKTKEHRFTLTTNPKRLSRSSTLHCRLRKWVLALSPTEKVSLTSCDIYYREHVVKTTTTSESPYLLN